MLEEALCVHMVLWTHPAKKWPLRPFIIPIWTDRKALWQLMMLKHKKVVFIVRQGLDGSSNVIVFTGSCGIELPPILNFIFCISNNISHYFNLVPFFLKCSCSYSCNLMVTSVYIRCSEEINNLLNINKWYIYIYFLFCNCPVDSSKYYTHQRHRYV